jgi:hypothetical protein
MLVCGVPTVGGLLAILGQPTPEMRTRRFALGAVFVYHLTLLHRSHHGDDLRVGLKAFLKAA